ncbi:MAG: hypothetical protein A2481_04390 [Candidatus Yonathbacteria bacterium RIFOXYC2_FULL_47_9]|nr:MAG: hypothetical protein A2481_04390 [Candidatus Yonathbacteria bacterium RIFOXYC2_FULL_47_9]HAT68831.1 hypothetical protein [Candidatus Yonathbacteria bacterium]
MRLDISYYSQYRDVTDPEWQKRACGVVCLKMLLDARGIQTPPLDEMIQDGVTLGAYSENGWLHDGLIELGAKYGGNLYRKEFRKKDADPETAERLNHEGIDALLHELEAGRPVIISAIKNFEISNKFHMVLVVGAEIEEGIVKGFYYHDPGSYTDTKGAYQFVPMNIFSKTWRRMAILNKN